MYLSMRIWGPSSSAIQANNACWVTVSGSIGVNRLSNESIDVTVPRHGHWLWSRRKKLQRDVKHTIKIFNDKKHSLAKFFYPSLEIQVQLLLTALRVLYNFGKCHKQTIMAITQVQWAMV
jgi:hypothetical protein